MVDDAENGDEGDPRPSRAKGVVPRAPRATDDLAHAVERLSGSSRLMEAALRATHDFERTFQGDLIRQATRLQEELQRFAAPQFEVARALKLMHDDSIGAAVRAQMEIMDAMRTPMADLLLQQDEISRGPMARLMADIARATTYELPSYMPERMNLSEILGDQLTAIASLAEIRSIGIGVYAGLAFDPGFASALRLDVGDWRDEVQWPAGLEASAELRESIYVDRGLSIEVSDISLSTLEGVFGLESRDEEDDEASLTIVIDGSRSRRAGQGFEIVRELEIQLRNWVNAAMTKEFGEDWSESESQIAPVMRDQWREKQMKAVQRGLPAGKLIDFADFTDYQQVICRKRNWSRIFIHGFDRQDNVRESFQRLHPSRLAVMHSRDISKADLLYLMVEAARLRSCLERLANRP